MGVEKGLENQRGCDLIDEGFVLPAILACGVEDFVGRARGEPLIPEGEGKGRQGGKLFGEALDFGRLEADFTREMSGQADDQADAAVAATESGQGAHVIARIGLSVEGEDGLGGEAEWIRDGNADALVAHVEAEEARSGWFLRWQIRKIAHSLSHGWIICRGQCSRFV